MDTQTFITKDIFKNLAGCITVVEACTETIKLLMGDSIYPYGVLLAFLFSIFVGFARFLMLGDYTKESFIMAMLNVVIIFLGAVGTYQVGVKSAKKLL